MSKYTCELLIKLEASLNIRILTTEIKKWLSFHIKWSRLKSIGGHKFISSMYIWLFLVPLLANTLSNVGGSFPITVFNHTFEFKASLPFSWQAFFYSALFFTLANLIRLSFCPKIINEHSDYASFKRSEMTGSHLAEYESEFEIELLVVARKMHITKLKTNMSKNDMSKIFWEIHEKANDTKKLAQYIAAIFYLFGFLLIGLVIFQNVNNVLTFW